MQKRTLVRELLVAYMNEKRVQYIAIKDFTREFKNRLPGVDVYRLTYHIGLNDTGFAIEKDEDTTYVRIL